METTSKGPNWNSPYTRTSEVLITVLKLSMSNPVANAAPKLQMWPEVEQGKGAPDDYYICDSAEPRAFQQPAPGMSFLSTWVSFGSLLYAAQYSGTD